jgi:hypothetical protein
MNANELADYLENDFQIQEAVIDMLREQQAEIEALKQIIDANNLSQNIGQFRKPANEPVAYGMLTFCKNCGEQNPYSVKTLTDAEIMESCHAYHYTGNPDYLGFAREILRKVQKADKIESLGTVNIGGVHYRNGKPEK